MGIRAEKPSVGTLQDSTDERICQAWKVCCKCGVPKQRSKFYKHPYNKDRLDCYCKECRKAQGREWHRFNRKEASQNKRLWTQKNYGAYSKTNNKARKFHRRRHPERAYAQGVLSGAIQSGRITPQPCRWPNCGSTEKIEGHHPQYDRPFEIVWLCHDHHKAADACNGKLGFDLKIDLIPKPRPCRRRRDSMVERNC